MEIFSQFGVNPILLAAQVVNFLILLFVLKKFMYKPLLKVLEERKVKIAQSLKNAEEIEKKLVQISEKESETLARASKEGEKIIKQAGEQVTQMIDEARVKAEGIINQATEESKRIAQAERVKLEVEIKEHLSDMVMLVLEKISGKVISGKAQKDIIEKEVKNLS